LNIKVFAFIIFILLLIFKTILVFFWVPSYYDTNEDYITHSLGHSINMDIWIRGGDVRKLSVLNTMHPGFLFQITSWLLYLPNSFNSHPYMAALETIFDPKMFWIKNQYVSFFINIGFIFYSLRWFKLDSKIDFSIYISLFYLFSKSFNFNFLHMGNETFAIPLFITLFVIFSKYIDTKKNYYLFLLGIIYSILYLNKINYIGYLPVIYFIFFLYFIKYFSNYSFKLFIFNSFFIILIFTISTYIFSKVLIGQSGINSMIESHTNVIFNSGPYGSGEKGLYDFNRMGNSLLLFLRVEWKFNIVLLPILFLNIYFIIKSYITKKVILYKNIFVVSSFFCILIVVLKQYSPHYILPAIITLPIMYILIRDKLNDKIKYTILIHNIIVIIFSLYSILTFETNFYFQSSISSKKDIQDYNSELESIRAIPLSENGYRSWGYRIKSREYGRRFAITWSDNWQLHKLLDIDFYKDQIDIDLEKSKPELLIYQKSYEQLFDKKWIKLYEKVYIGNHLIVYKLKTI
jgi:hypothetical protein